MDWHALARQYGVAVDQVRRLYEVAERRARTRREPRRQQEAIFLELLEEAREAAARPAPGKVTRTMGHVRTQRRRSNISPMTGQPIAPGKRTLTAPGLPRAGHGQDGSKTQERALLEAIHDASGRTKGVEGAGPKEVGARHSGGLTRRIDAAWAIATGNFDELDEQDRVLYGVEATAVREAPVELEEPDADALDPAAPDDVVPQPGRRGELPFRGELERLFGEQLDGIHVERRDALPRGALAAAEHERIVFASTAPSKATVAHEVAHVLQYRRGAPRTAAGIGERGDPAECEAHHAAAAVLAGRTVRIQGLPTAQMHLQEPEEAGAQEAEYGVTVTANSIDFARRDDGLQVEVMWYALLWQEGRDHRPLREGESPPQFAAPRLRTSVLVRRLEEHTGLRMLEDRRQGLLARREIPLIQRDPYSYTVDLSADELRQWFGGEAWQGFLDGRHPAGRDEALAPQEYIASLPPRVREIIHLGTEGRALAASDHAQLLRVVQKIEAMPPGQVADYLSRINGTTTDLTELEASLDAYVAEMAQRAVQTEEREAVQTRLYGLEEVYARYRQYRSMLMIEALNAGMSFGLGPRASTSMREELTQQLQAHGFASISELEGYIRRFEEAFEHGAATMVLDLLARYEGTLYREAERYKDPGEIAALYQKLGGMRRHHAEFERNAAISNDHDRSVALRALPWHGHLPPSMASGQAMMARRQAEVSKRAAQAEIQNLSAEHSVFQEKGLPLDRRIDKTALAEASESELGGLLSGHISSRIADIREARSQLQGNSELIYKMEGMMPQFYAQQGIAPGSIYDAIIQDKLRDDAIIRLAGGILLAIVAVALTVVSLGSATPALVAAGAAAGAFGVSGYMVYDEYKQYTEQQALADVGLADDPSIVWLVLAVAGAAVDMAAAVKAVRALAPAAKALNAGGDVSAFTEAVQALQKTGEIDARIAQAAEQAALARHRFAEASGELVKALGGKFYSFPGPFTDPDIFRILVRMAKAKIQEGVSSFQAFAAELKKARARARLDDLSPEELAKAKEAWEQALRLARSAENPIDILGESGRVIGKYSNGSHLEVISRGKDTLHGGNTIRLDPQVTTTVTGTLGDVNTVAIRGQRLPSATQVGPNPGGINILRSPQWSAIQAKYKGILESGDMLRYWRTVTDEFWEAVNKPWLDEAIARGDNFRFVSNPTDDIAIHVTDPKGRFVLDEAGNRIKSIFGREVDYLMSKGYTFLSDGTAVKPQ